MMVACCSERASVCSALLFRIAHRTRQGPNPEYLLGARASADRWEVGRGVSDPSEVPTGTKASLWQVRRMLARVRGANGELR
jgi:hypothetical protein